MDCCPSILKSLKNRNNQGFSIIELVVVIGIFAVLLFMVVSVLNPSTQIGKSRDARRKTDLQKFKSPLEDYYNDNKCYPEVALLECNPGEGFKPYMNKVPCDPLTNDSYYYERPDCRSYRIYAKLEYTKDADIVRLGCVEGCGPGDPGIYNYGISSPNISLEGAVVVEISPAVSPTNVVSSPTPSITPAATPTDEPACLGSWYACQKTAGGGSQCNNYGSKPDCYLGGYAVCNDCPVCGTENICTD